MANLGGEAMIATGEAIGLEGLFGTATAGAAAVGFGSVLAPAVGIGLLAYSLYDLL
jgi:hypothetical protein